MAQVIELPGRMKNKAETAHQAYLSSMEDLARLKRQVDWANANDRERWDAAWARRSEALAAWLSVKRGEW